MPCAAPGEGIGGPRKAPRSCLSRPCLHGASRSAPRPNDRSCETRAATTRLYNEKPRRPFDDSLTLTLTFSFASFSFSLCLIHSLNIAMTLTSRQYPCNTPRFVVVQYVTCDTLCILNVLSICCPSSLSAVFLCVLLDSGYASSTSTCYIMADNRGSILLGCISAFCAFNIQCLFFFPTTTTAVGRWITGGECEPPPSATGLVAGRVLSSFFAHPTQEDRRWPK